MIQHNRELFYDRYRIASCDKGDVKVLSSVLIAIHLSGNIPDRERGTRRELLSFHGEKESRFRQFQSPNECNPFLF